MVGIFYVESQCPLVPGSEVLACGPFRHGSADAFLKLEYFNPTGRAVLSALGVSFSSYIAVKPRVVSIESHDLGSIVNPERLGTLRKGEYDELAPVV